MSRKETIPHIAFYSYKGGTGRTLALVQMAACLSHMGKRVLVLDLDLESPSIDQRLLLLGDPLIDVNGGDPGKRKTAPSHSWTRSSLLHIMREGLAEAVAGDHVTKCACCDLLALEFDQYEPIFGDRSVSLREYHFGDGIVYALPTGLAIRSKNAVEYFDELHSPNFQLFLLQAQRFKSSFDKLRMTLEKNQGRSVDYVLIDASSGVNTLAYIATHILADRVILLTANHPEGIQGTRLLLPALASKKPTVVAVSKIPASFINEYGVEHVISDEEVRRLLQRVRDELVKGTDVTLRDRDVLPLRLEPLLSFREHLPIPFENGSPDHGFLPQDYMNLFCAVLPSRKQSKFKKHVRPYLSTKHYVQRKYYLEPQAGKMINPGDNSWNVALRADTLGRTLDRLVDSCARALQAAGKDRGEAVRLAQEELRNVGEDAAKGFATDLLSRWSRNGRSNLTIGEMITLWCEFDSTVGFGTFELLPSSSDTEGTIALRDNVLLLDRDRSDYDLCRYWVGYITTVLREITRHKHLDVVHDTKAGDCGQYDRRGSTDCVFHYCITRRR